MQILRVHPKVRLPFYLLLGGSLVVLLGSLVAWGVVMGLLVPRDPGSWQRFIELLVWRGLW